MKICYVIDPIYKLKPAKDTTIALMREAQSRGHENFITTLGDLDLLNNKAIALLKKIELCQSEHSFYKIVSEETTALPELDLVLMRKDPPFDNNYLAATYILDTVYRDGTIVINDPSSLRNYNEKLAASLFPELCPPNIVSTSKSSILDFLEDHQKIVVKPLHKMGGQSIYVMDYKNPNKHVILEDLTQKGGSYITAQKYIPEISTDGDKRIILINGVPVPYGLKRLPSSDDHRGNLSAGASSQGYELTQRDMEICNAIAPFLLENGLFFVGIDVIGNYLTEINITSPTGIVEIEKQCGYNSAAVFFDTVQSIYFH